jgi:hypothetical protein
MYLVQKYYAGNNLLSGNRHKKAMFLFAFIATLFSIVVNKKWNITSIQAFPSNHLSLILIPSAFLHCS